MRRRQGEVAGPEGGGEEVGAAEEVMEEEDVGVAAQGVVLYQVVDSFSLRGCPLLKQPPPFPPLPPLLLLLLPALPARHSREEGYLHPGPSIAG